MDIDFLSRGALRLKSAVEINFQNHRIKSNQVAILSNKCCANALQILKAYK